MNESKTQRRVALVTGAGSGIGKAVATRFAHSGAAVALIDLDLATARAVGTELEKEFPLAEILAVRCDVSRELEVEAVTGQVMGRWGRLDVVVNNAGTMVFKPLEAHTREDWLRTLEVDLLGAFYFIRQAFRLMKPGGAIVNVSSIHAVETTPHVAAYAAAKAALVSLTSTAAIEGKPRGLRVNAVLPGAIDTPMLWENPNVKSGLEVIDRTDVGTPDDVAALIEFLASPDARFVEGTAVRVDGGRLVRL